MALTDQWTGCTPGWWGPDENQAEVDRVVSAGAFVMGRNMLGPIRDDWDPSWRGWWGEDPPYHPPVHQRLVPVVEQQLQGVEVGIGRLGAHGPRLAGGCTSRRRSLPVAVLGKAPASHTCLGYL